MTIKIFLGFFFYLHFLFTFFDTQIIYVHLTLIDFIEH